MIPAELQLLPIREIVDFITNVDERDLRENFASNIRGFRLARTGLVAERDFGTINRYAAANYPSTPTAITMIDGIPFYVPSEAATYDIIAGLDTSTKTRLYAGNGTSFEELTQVYSLVIDSISGSTLVSTAATLLDSAGATVSSKAADYFENYILAHHEKGKATLVIANTLQVGSGAITFTFLNKPDVALGLSVGDTVYLYRFTGLLPDSVIGTGRGYEFSNGATPHLRWLGVEGQQKMFMYYGNSSTPTTAKQPIQIRKGKFFSPDALTIGGTTTGWEEVYDFGSQSARSAHVVGRAITGATNATPIEITLTAHGLSNGTEVYITGVQGNTAANGNWVITSTGVDTFTLNGSVGNGVYTTGGVVQYLWVAFDRGIYFSRDGGDSFTLQKDVTSANIVYSIQMIDHLIGYASGRQGAVWRTLDGGTTWTNIGGGITVGATDLYFLSVVDSNTVYVSGNDRVFKSTNAAGGGPTWTSVEDGATTTVYGLHFIDASKGWYIDNTLIWQTTNGGTSWTSYARPTSSWIGDLKFADANTGWIAGVSGLIYKTTNGGSTWASQSSGIIEQINWIEVLSTTNIRVCSRYGYIAVTTDGGASWTVEPRVVTDHLLELSMMDNSNGYAVGDNGKVLRLTGSAGATGTGAANGWYIDKAQLNPDFETVGTPGAPLAGNDPDQTITLPEGIQFSIAIEEEDDTGFQNNLRMYCTMLYRDILTETIHQESDPIFQLCLKPTVNNKWAYPVITVKLNPGLLNKNFIGFRFYTAMKDENDLSYLDWIDDSAEYLQSYDLLTTTPGWEYDDTSEYCIYATVNQFTAIDMDEIVAAGPSNIQDNLNHVPDTNRAYLTPRYGVKATRQQGAIIAVDEGDRTVRLSTYDGDGVHQEDNYPDITVDNTGERQQIELTGHGELMGLAILRGVIYAFKSTELERYDLQSGIRDIIPIDFFAKKSLVKIGVSDNPNGLLWTGNSGIYYLPISGGKPMMLSGRISNLFDGSKITNDGVTPYITDAYRQAIICGYDQLYREAWIQVQINKAAGAGATEIVCLRYNFDVQKFFVRQLNLTGSFSGAANEKAIFFYGRVDDHSFTIGTPQKILKYPLRVSPGAAHIYEDDVSSAGVSASRGIPTNIRINVGSFYGLQVSVIPWDILIDYVASVVSNDLLSINIYGNGLSSGLLDQKTYSLGNAKGVPMLMEPWGQIESLEIELSLDGTLVNYKKLEIRQIDLRFVKQQRIGIE